MLSVSICEEVDVSGGGFRSGLVTDLCMHPSQYPWSTRHLTIAPPTNPSIPAISPFPRYGLSLPPIPTQSGHLLIFGGLVRETVRNDLYALDCQDFSTALVPATGEIPIPRVGHASALVRSVLIVWGGDTKTRMEEDQDESLYLFNIRE